MATFLELCQKLNTLSGTQGTFSSVSATGHQSIMAEIVRNAWIDIQALRKDWEFLKKDVSMSTVVGQTEYDATTDLASDIQDIRVIYDSDNAPLIEVSQDYYIQNDLASAGATAPSMWWYDYTNNLLTLNPPDGVYTIDVHYLAKPQILTDNTDTPLLPSEFHNAILYRALVDYGAYLGNGSMYQAYLTKADSIIGSAMRSFIPARKIRTIGIA